MWLQSVQQKSAVDLTEASNIQNMIAAGTIHTLVRNIFFQIRLPGLFAEFGYQEFKRENTAKVLSLKFTFN